MTLGPCGSATRKRVLPEEIVAGEDSSEWSVANGECHDRTRVQHVFAKLNVGMLAAKWATATQAGVRVPHICPVLADVGLHSHELVPWTCTTRVSLCGEGLSLLRSLSAPLANRLDLVRRNVQELEEFLVLVGRHLLELCVPAVHLVFIEAAGVHD